MKKGLTRLKFCFLFVNILFCTDLIAQSTTSNLTKTMEYTADGRKRREIFYDESMEIVRENYFGDYDYKNLILCSIEYRGSKIIKVSGYNKKGEVVLFFDGVNGVYNDYYSNTELRFESERFLKDRYISFDGIQKGDGIVVRYTKGKKNGMLVQTDSAETGSKNVTSSQVDTRLLRFNIIKFYSTIEQEPVYTLYKGLKLNFLNGYLEGNQESAFYNGKTRFKAKYRNGRLIEYQSYDENASTISKIQTNKYGLTEKPQILNGTLLPVGVNYIFYQPEIMKVGDITSSNFLVSSSLNARYVTSNYLGDGGGIKFNKSEFDNIKDLFDNPKDMFALLKIPKFSISKFDFDRDETTFTVPLAINKTISIDSSGFICDSTICPVIDNYFDAERIFSITQLKLHDGQWSDYTIVHEVSSVISSTYPFKDNEWERYLKITGEIEKWLREKYTIQLNKYSAYDIVDTSKIYEDVKPSFPGGKANLDEFLINSINWSVPNDNQAPNGQYTVGIQFVVDLQGKVTNIVAITNNGYGMEEELIRVARSLPNWYPAKVRNQQVKSYGIIAVKFEVEKTEEIKSKKKKR